MLIRSIANESSSICHIGISSVHEGPRRNVLMTKIKLELFYQCIGDINICLKVFRLIKVKVNHKTKVQFFPRGTK